MVTRIDPRRLDAESWHREVEDVVRAAVDVLRRDDVISGAQERGECKVHGGHAARRANSSDAAFEGGNAFLEDRNCRVRDATVDVTWKLEVEEGRCFVRVGELVRSRVVDRLGPCARDRVRMLTCVQAQCVESQKVGLDHGLFPFGLTDECCSDGIA